MKTLNEIINEEIEASNDVDPRSVAMRVVMRIDDKHLRSLAAVALVDTVRIRMTRMRRDAFRRTLVRPATRERKMGVEPAAPSKWAQYEQAERILRATVSVEGEWKRMRDCTADDLETVAAEHDRRAEEARAVAARYRRLAELVRATESTKLGEVDMAAIEAAVSPSLAGATA